MHKKLTMALFALALILSSEWQAAHAEGEAWRQHTETLPSYCAYRLTPAGKENKSNRYPALRSVWIHIHHYCAGIYAENQAKMSLDDRKKRQYLEQVIYQMNYVGKHCTPQCILYPELHTRLGWALKEMGKLVEATEQFHMAIKAKPDYAKAYAQLADLYADNHRVEDARRVLQKGLKVIPNSRSLKRRLDRLGKE